RRFLSPGRRIAEVQECQTAGTPECRIPECRTTGPPDRRSAGPSQGKMRLFGGSSNVELSIGTILGLTNPHGIPAARRTAGRLSACAAWEHFFTETTMNAYKKPF